MRICQALCFEFGRSNSVVLRQSMAHEIVMPYTSDFFLSIFKIKCTFHPQENRGIPGTSRLKTGSKDCPQQLLTGDYLNIRFIPFMRIFFNEP